jgi:hypothetical protein
MDNLVDTLGWESIRDYENQVQCCDGVLSIVEPEKSQEMIGSVTFCVGTESGPNARSVRLEHSQPT